MDWGVFLYILKMFNSGVLYGVALGMRLNSI
jgi:hypothetical protein